MTTTTLSLPIPYIAETSVLAPRVQPSLLARMKGLFRFDLDLPKAPIELSMEDVMPGLDYGRD